MAEDNDLIENFVYDEITLGQSAKLVRTLTPDDIAAFAAVSGDTNPAHMDVEYANNTTFHGVIAHGMWGGSLISTLLGTVFPGAGTIYVEQTLRFSRPVRIGDTLVVTATATEKNDSNHRLTLDCRIVNQHNALVLSGTAIVVAPTQKIRRARTETPLIRVFDPESHLKVMLDRAAKLPTITCGVVHPCDRESLSGAMEAASMNLIDPILIGPQARIEAIAEELGLDLKGVRILGTQHSHDSAAQAAAMAESGQIDALMKGSLHTDELLHAVVTRPALLTERRISHVFYFDLPMYRKPLLLSDAAINIHPDLAQKADIVRNAITLAHALEIELPHVALLSAVETVNPRLTSTIDAAALCKMADRGQIKGGILDGPLAFDNAISMEAARIKNIPSPVAGNADVLIVPDLEAGNMLAKQLEYFASELSAGIVMGAQLPIALTSRSDTRNTRVASAALAALMSYQRLHAGKNDVGY